MLTGIALTLTGAAGEARGDARPTALSETVGIQEYHDFAMSHDGNAQRGRELFLAEDKAACIKCHSIDGSGGKAGPDLSSIGDTFPRDELIRAILEPSGTIAVGYGATIVETTSGQEYVGVIKNATDSFIELISADGKLLHIPTADIK